MKQYLAIINRDYAANAGETLWLPAPVFSILFAILATWWMTWSGMNFQAWYFLAVTLFAAYRMLEDLDLSHGHNLGFLAPNFKIYQYNYSTSLLLLSCLITSAVFSDSAYEFFISASLLWFLVSLMFFLVKKIVWQLAHVFLFCSVLLFAPSIFSLGLSREVLTLFPTMYAGVWSVLSEPTIGVLVSLICSAISIKCFLIARSRYVQPQEYNTDELPRTWKKHKKELSINVLQVFSNQTRISRIWGKIESKVLLTLDIGRHKDILYLGLFGARTHRLFLEFILGFLLSICLLPLFFASSVNQEAVLIPICIFMLFYLVVISSVISLEWITNRHSIADLWLLDSSESRAAYMFKLAMLFAERIGRVSLVSSLAFILLATIISGVRGLMIVSLVALAGLTLSALLQISYVLFVTLKVKHTGWLRYVTFLFTGINFVGWLSIVFFSIHNKNYWILVLAMGVAVAICIASINYWCRYDKELSA